MTLKLYVAKVWVQVRILPAHLLSWQRYLSNGHLFSQTYHSRKFLGVNRGRINQETFVGQRIERELESGCAGACNMRPGIEAKLRCHVYHGVSAAAAALASHAHAGTHAT